MNPTTCLNSFKAWLISKSYSLSTIRNYIADTNKYLQFASSGDFFSSAILHSYLDSISSDHNQDRYTSSLTKFFQFALDQKIIQINPFKENDQLSPTEIFQAYQASLTKQKFSTTTIKNYLNDIQQFIDWLNQNQLAQ